MDEEIVYNAIYKGRRLVVKKMFAKYNSWYCGYIEIKNKKELRVEIFDGFDISFTGDLFYDGVKYAGFDTMAPFMTYVTKNDCIKELKKTADKLNNG